MTVQIAIGWDNRIDPTALSTDSQVATLPVANLAVDDVRQVWRATTVAAQIVADLGALVTIGGTLLAHTNLVATDTVRNRVCMGRQRTRLSCHRA